MARKKKQRGPQLDDAARAAIASLSSSGLFAARSDAELEKLLAESERATVYDAIVAHLVLGREADVVALRAPLRASEIRRAPGIAELVSDADDFSRNVRLALPGKRPRVLSIYRYADIIAIAHVALRALGDERRFVALRTNDPDEQVYLFATPSQVAVLKQIGWADPYPPSPEIQAELAFAEPGGEDEAVENVDASDDA